MTAAAAAEAAVDAAQMTAPAETTAAAEAAVDAAQMTAAAETPAAAEAAAEAAAATPAAVVAPAAAEAAQGAVAAPPAAEAVVGGQGAPILPVAAPWNQHGGGNDATDDAINAAVARAREQARAFHEAELREQQGWSMQMIARYNAATQIRQGSASAAGPPVQQGSASAATPPVMRPPAQLPPAAVTGPACMYAHSNAHDLLYRSWYTLHVYTLVYVQFTVSPAKEGENMVELKKNLQEF
jgi:hypothetical protein